MYLTVLLSNQMINKQKNEDYVILPYGKKFPGADAKELRYKITNEST